MILELVVNDEGRDVETVGQGVDFRAGPELRSERVFGGKQLGGEGARGGLAPLVASRE